MLEELQSWWQSMTPESQAAALAVSLIIIALLGAHFLPGSRNASCAPITSTRPSVCPALAPPQTQDYPALVTGLLVRLRVVAIAISLLARRNGRDDISDTVRLIMSRSWPLAAILVFALTRGGLLARRLMAWLPGGPKMEASSRNDTVAPRWNPAGNAGAGAYVLVMLIVLIMAADLFDWPLTRACTLSLWQLAQHLIIAVAGLVIGCLGAHCDKGRFCGEKMGRIWHIWMAFH